jgi:hypothetical protein
VIYKRVFNVPPKSSPLRGCRGELEIAKGHGIGRLIREETKCPPIPSSPIKVSHQSERRLSVAGIAGRSLGRHSRE